MLKYLCLLKTSIAVDKLQIIKLKNNLIYVVLICLSVACEIFAAWNAETGIRAIETFIFRQAVTLILAMWYYQSQGSKLTNLQRNFLMTLLIPLIFGFSRYFIPDPLAIKVNAFFILVPMFCGFSNSNHLEQSLKYPNFLLLTFYSFHSFSPFHFCIISLCYFRC